ncbi:hypothetical protein GCM10010168_48390 [Actinoplanes ianthinogenes]|uniref:Lipoprotein n=1 Tax=Actinoplanes ianthinogenes TaxID=122358 RepID=A0ABM7LNQ4_9ACTN|nr:hypothetical protein [Actinoplanes ianthinogenes]BCJ40862.1 hypothetical protein Aiant_15190 [Actinoplanes ianthinogenes]GGR24694.1 hypothetical protein GCM10010168_48390 [Actinoplanes ianthinogenes]
MKMRRLAVTGVAVMALAGMGACGDKKPAPATDAGATGAPAAATTAAAAGSSEAKSELLAGVTKLTSSSAKIHMTSFGGIVGDGAFDGPKKLVDMKLDMGSLGSVSMRQLGTDLYMRYGGPAAKNFANGKWMHIDASKMPAGSALSMEKNDPRNSAKMLESATEVKAAGKGKYSGTLDIAKSPSATPQLLKLLDGKDTQVPFTAEINSDGYLSKMSVDLSGIGAGESVATYADMGTPVTVTKPPAQQTVEMPKSALQAMGG